MPEKYLIAPGKSLTTTKGIVAEGDEVTPGHFTDQAIFDAWLEKEVVLTEAEYKKALHYMGQAPLRPGSAVEVEPVAEEKPPVLKLGATKRAK